MKTGAEQLKDWMHRRRFLQQEAAEHFGWPDSYISHLVHGRRLPALDNAIKIERETGIPVEAWMSSELDKANGTAPGNGRNRKLAKA